MEKLLIATTNQGKVKEISSLLAELPFVVLGLHELEAPPPPIEETGNTFTANAILKAEYYFAETGILALADDSGLEIDALNGAPGIYSARFAGEHATDAERVTKILAELEGVPAPARTARFVCSIAISGALDPKAQTFVFEGIAEGFIATAAQGTGGFGYDPIFVDPELQVTFAELSTTEKSRRSHRGKALAAARDFLTNLAVKRD